MRPFWFLVDCFDKEEAKFIREFKLKEERAKTFNKRKFFKSFIRKSTVGWFNQGENEDIDKLMNKAVDILFQVAYHEYHTYVNSVEPIQRTRYKNFGHYKSHFDVGAQGPHRLMSATVELTNPDDYIGGGIKFKDLKDQPKLKEGSMLVFPSMLKHKACPVYKGTRQSLVLWASNIPSEKEKENGT